MTTNNTGRNQINTAIEVPEWTVPNTFGFTLEFPSDREVIVRMNDTDKTSKPFYIGTGSQGRVHGLMNATCAIWTTRYPVTTPGFSYLRSTFEDAEKTLGFENMGYIKGTDELVKMVSDGLITHLEPIVMKRWYRLAWNGHRFTLKLTQFKPYEAGEDKFTKHDRNAISLMEGLDDFYKAQALGLSIHLYFGDGLAWMVGEKVEHYKLVKAGKIDDLKRRIASGVAKRKAYVTQTYYEHHEEKVEAINQRRRGIALELIDGSRVQPEGLVGHTIRFWVGKFPILGIHVITAEKLAVMTAVIRKENYLVEIIE